VGDVEGDNSEARTLSNPLGLDYSVMRGSLLSSLKAAADHNLRQGAKEVRLFEIAPVHRGHKDGTTEHMHLAFVWNGEYTVDSLLTQRKIRKVQEADLLGVAADLGFRGRADVVELGEGLLGLELPLDSLEDASDTVIPAFRPFSRFMRVERDLSLMVDLDQSYEALVQAMAKPLPGDYLVEGPVLVDIFRHKSLPVGKQAWLMRMVFQAEDRTLTSEEVDAWVAKALDAARSFGAELRS
jgi:phenylalanyl-tRNA synthetase beta chain